MNQQNRSGKSEAKARLQKFAVMAAITVGALVFVVVVLVREFLPRLEEERKISSREEFLHGLQSPDRMWTGTFVFDSKFVARIFLGYNKETKSFAGVLLPSGDLPDNGANKLYPVRVALTEKEADGGGISYAAKLGANPEIPTINENLGKSVEGEVSIQEGDISSGKIDVNLVVRVNIMRRDEKKYSLNLLAVSADGLGSAVEKWLKNTEQNPGEPALEYAWRCRLNGRIPPAESPPATIAPAPVAKTEIPKAGIVADKPAPKSEITKPDPPKIPATEDMPVSRVTDLAAAYFRLGDSEAGGEDEVNGMLARDQKIWYYDGEKSYSEVVASSADWNRKNPFRRYRVDENSIRCTGNSDGFDVSLQFEARVGRDFESSKPTRRKAFVRISAKGGTPRITKVATCAMTEDVPFPGWFLARYQAYISRADVSRKDGTPFSDLPFENEASKFREIILQDRVNLLNGKGDPGDDAAGWFEHEGSNHAKLIEIRRRQLEALPIHYSGPKEELFAGGTSVIVEICYKDKVLIRIGERFGSPE